MRRSFCFIIFYLFTILIGNLLFAQERIFLHQIRKSGIVLFRAGKESKIYFGKTNTIVQKRKLKKIISQSNVFYEPTDIKNLIRKTLNEQCDNFINIVGSKYSQKKTLNFNKEVVEYILFDEELFEIFLCKDDKVESLGYTFAFCNLKKE